MSFKLIPNTAPIKFPVTVIDLADGQKVESKVTLHFQFQEDYRKTPLTEALVGWEGVLDPNGEPLPFTPENRERALGHLAFSAAIHEAFFAVARGDHLRKN